MIFKSCACPCIFLSEKNITVVLPICTLYVHFHVCFFWQGGMDYGSTLDLKLARFLRGIWVTNSLWKDCYSLLTYILVCLRRGLSTGTAWDSQWYKYRFDVEEPHKLTKTSWKKQHDIPSYNFPCAKPWVGLARNLRDAGFKLSQNSPQTCKLNLNRRVLEWSPYTYIMLFIENIALYIYTYVYIYIFLHKYIYIYLHIYTNIYTYIYLHKYIYIYLYIYLHKYIYIYLYLYIYTNIYIYIYTYIYIFVYIFTHIYIFVYIYIYIYIYIYTCTCMYRYLAGYGWLIQQLLISIIDILVWYIDTTIRVNTCIIISKHQSSPCWSYYILFTEELFLGFFRCV